MDWSVLSFLPFIGDRFKKSGIRVEYVKSDLTITIESLPLDNTQKYDCKCCLSLFDSEEIITCSKSSKDDLHTFCKQCVSDYINNGMVNGEAKNACMCRLDSGKCSGTISAQHILKCTNKETYDKFEEMFEIQEIKKFHKILNNYQICPHCFKYGTIANKDIKKCKKTNCNKKWCTKCKKSYSSGHICKRIEDAKNIDAIRILVEETINYALMHKCPKCSSMYVKEDGRGCNHMTCSLCKASSCYLCGSLMSSHVGSSCRQYNNTGHLTEDQGNWLYNRKKIINECEDLLRANNKDVQMVMINELEKNKIYIDIDNLQKQKS